jgi:hypothetical protein
VARRGRFTDREIKEIFSKPFDIFPEPSNEAKALGITKRGPLGWQKEVFNFLQKWEIRARNNGKYHQCYMDRSLIWSGSGSGKSVILCGLHLWFASTFPGSETVSGAYRYNTIEEIHFPIFKKLLSIVEPWDHPALIHKPNKQDKWMTLQFPVRDPKDPENPDRFIMKESTIFFSQLSDDEILRGKNLVFASAEELSQLKDPMVIDELERRLRSSEAPYNALVGVTNPPDSFSHFMFDKWPSLFKLMPDYEGELPESRLCRCHYCPKCDEKNLGSFEWDEYGFCTNPNCAWLEASKSLHAQGHTGVKVAPFQRSKNRYTDLDGVERDHVCPGNQDYWRVLNPSPGENIHVASTMMQGLKSSQDEKNFQVYSQGVVMPLSSDKVYCNYSFMGNTLLKPIQVDTTKDIYWTHDHNNRPRCSAIIQEYPNEEVGIPKVMIVDEIVMYEAKVPRYDDETKLRIKGAFADDVAVEFIERYKDWNEAGIAAGKQKTVYLFGDPTALNRKQAHSSSLNEFQIMKKMLEKAGFKVVNTVQTRKGSQISVKERLAITNYMLRDPEGKTWIKINRKECPHAIKSFSDVERLNNDMEAIDKSCDELARRTSNPNAIHLISHITDAIGYYLARKFNLIQIGESEFKFIYISDTAILRVQKDGKIEMTPDKPTPLRPRRESNDVLDIIRQSMRETTEDYGMLRDFYGF